MAQHSGAVSNGGGHYRNGGGPTAPGTPKGVPTPAHDLLGASGQYAGQDGFTTYYGANPGPGWSHRKNKTLATTN